MTKKIVFANSWQSFFAESGFNSFEDFFDYSSREQISKNSKRDVAVLRVGNGTEQKVFFLKRFHNPHLKDILGASRVFGRPGSLAAVEWSNTHLLLKYGIRTHQPICFGQRTKWGLEEKSFFVTEKLPGQCLGELVAGNWARISQLQKEEIIISLAKSVRKIHNARISLPDLYLWHIFIEQNPDQTDWNFAFIDVPRMTHNVTNKNHHIRNLGKLDHSMPDKYFGDTLRLLFIESYAGTDWPGGPALLAAKVKKYSKKISSRRKPKQY